VKNFLLSAFLILDSGLVCIGIDVYKTKNFYASSEIECIDVPLKEEAYKCIKPYLIDYLKRFDEDN